MKFVEERRREEQCIKHCLVLICRFTIFFEHKCIVVSETLKKRREKDRQREGLREKKRQRRKKKYE